MHTALGEQSHHSWATARALVCVAQVLLVVATREGFRPHGVLSARKNRVCSGYININNQQLHLHILCSPCPHLFRHSADSSAWHPFRVRPCHRCSLHAHPWKKRSRGRGQSSSGPLPSLHLFPPRCNLVVLWRGLTLNESESPETLPSQEGSGCFPWVRFRKKRTGVKRSTVPHVCLTVLVAKVY